MEDTDKIQIILADNPAVDLSGVEFATVDGGTP